VSFTYEINPIAIEQESFRQIRELTNLEGLSRAAQQVVMRIVHSIGMPEVAAQVRFSEAACENGEWTATKAVTSRSARVLMEGWVRVPGDCF